MKRIVTIIPGLVLFIFGVWLALAPFKIGGGQYLTRCGPAVSAWLAGPNFGKDSSNPEPPEDGLSLTDYINSATREPTKISTPNLCYTQGTWRAIPGLLAGLIGGILLAISTRMKGGAS